MKVLFNTLISIGASVVLLVPAASAGPRPDDRPGPRGPGAIAQSSESELWVDPALAEAVDTARAGGVRPDDRAGRREVPLTPLTFTPAVPDSFDWGDAGIGAGAVGGILALLLASTLLARRSRRELEHA